MEREMNDRELERDPLLAAAMRWADGEVPLDEVDWSAMRTNIRSRAELPLARRRALHAASPRWMRPLVPLAVAAGIAAVMWVGALEPGATPLPGTATGAVSAAAAPSIQDALLSDVSDQEFRLLVADPNDPDELLMIAASQR